MVAAADAFTLALRFIGEPETALDAALTVLLALVGGAIEGLAVGIVQWRLLRRWLTGLTASAWVGVTVLAAVVGWALGTLPAVLVSMLASDAEGTASSGPPLWVMPLAGVAAGAVLGAIFGLMQARVLRHHVSNAGVWVWANALGWASAMAVMLTGASTPDAPWPWTRLLPLAALTGILAGLTIGAVTGAFLPRLKPRSV